MGVGIGKVIRCKLLALKKDVGGYITYVFKNLNSTNVYDEYVMCVRFPNWDCYNLEIGDIGFLKYRMVEAGVDKWYDRENDKFELYRQTDCHFINFIKEQENVNKDITL